ncbi:hypothetical protein IL306_001710 [Fusarium sp. DS 682]|nr:hypothetical protein IL306_001710 [Fusarium sp. DS 682]
MAKVKYRICRSGSTYNFRSKKSFVTLTYCPAHSTHVKYLPDTQMRSSQRRRKLKLRRYPRYRAWQFRQAWLLRYRRHYQRLSRAVGLSGPIRLSPRQEPSNINANGNKANCDRHGSNPSDNSETLIGTQTQNTRVKLSIKSTPHHEPIPFELHITSDGRPYSRIPLPSTAAVLKRRRLSNESENGLSQDQQRPPMKRRHLVISDERDEFEKLSDQQDVLISRPSLEMTQTHIPPEPRRQRFSRDDRADNSGLSIRQGYREHMSPRKDMSAEYRVDLGAIPIHLTPEDRTVEDSAPKDEPEDSLPLQEQELPRNQNNITTPPQNNRTSITSHIFTWFLIILIFGLYTQLYRKALSHRPFQPVNWFQQAIDIEASQITVSRVVLFGEAALEPPQWKGQPGLLPDPDGPLDAGYRGMSGYESAQNSIYKPWETSSNGTYVPEHVFLIDLRNVLESALADLKRIADHGPHEFRFTQGTSTQFRWSTRSGSFISPHDSLPTIPFREYLANRKLDEPDSTILEMPPIATETPSPTARPEGVNLIFNLDPPLSRLSRRLKRVVSVDLIIGHSYTRNYLVDVFPYGPWAGVTGVWFDLDLLLREQRGRNGSFGSDQERLDCMFPSRVYDRGDNSPVPMPARPQDMSDVPDDIPEEYLDKVFRAHYSRMSSRSSRPTSKPAASSSPEACRPTKHPTPKQWDSSQVHNVTASRLTKIVSYIASYDLGRKRTNKIRHLWSVVEYSDALAQACKDMEIVNQRISQVLTTDYQSNIDWKEQTRAVNRLRYVAPFLNDIAAVRLCEMSRRASRGALLLRQVEQKQHKLMNDISQGFVTADNLLNFPSIESLLFEMELMSEWFKTEVASISTLSEARRAKFDISWQRHFEELDISTDRNPIWSRWGRHDTRSDPFGWEAICWDFAKNRWVKSSVDENGQGWEKNRCGLR